MPGMVAMAEDIAEPMPLGAPAPDWLSVTDLQASDNFKAIVAAQDATSAAILKSKNFDVKIAETLNTTNVAGGKMVIALALQGNKTTGHSYQKTSATGPLKSSAALLDCGYTKGKYFVAFNKNSGLDDVSLKQALTSIKAGSAKRFYDANGYQFDMQPQSCFTDPKPAHVLGAVTSSEIGSVSISSLVSSIVLAPTNHVHPVELTRAAGGQVYDTYVLNGETANPENSENSVGFAATFYVNAKSGLLKKLSMHLSEPGMGFNIDLTYEYLKTSAVTVKVATDHAVSGVAVQRAINQIGANQWALGQAKGLAAMANGGLTKRPAKKITPKSLMGNAAANHYKATRTSKGIKLNYKITYKAPTNAKKTSTVTGHACVIILKGRASAKACK